MPKTAVRKAAALYSAPKVVVVKTGQRCRAAVDRVGLVTLQSVYNIHVEGTNLTPAFVCGLLNSDAVHQRFIAPITNGKRIFPQITQRMIRDIRLPPIDDALIARVTALVHRLERGADSATERTLQAVFEALYDSAHDLV